VECKKLRADKKIVQTSVDTVLLIHSFDQVPNYKAFPLIPLNVEHFQPIRIYKPGINETGRPQSVRLLYKTNGKLIEKVDLTIKMKFKYNPRNQFDIGDTNASLCSNKVSDLMMVGKGDVEKSATILFGCRFWYDLSRKFHCEQAKILIMVSFSMKIQFQTFGLINTKNY
jgi:hypothetical protein